MTIFSYRYSCKKTQPSESCNSYTKQCLDFQTMSVVYVIINHIESSFITINVSVVYVFQR